jgi:hypothetical protein
MIKLASLVFWLALELFRWLERRQMLDQARLDAFHELEKVANVLIDGAKRAADSVSNDPADILVDPNNRDKPGEGDPSSSL